MLVQKITLNGEWVGGGELFKLNVEKRKSFTWQNRWSRQINA